MTKINLSFLGLLKFTITCKIRTNVLQHKGLHNSIPAEA